jgi:selenocysteine lyase/cysteine desulfurase
MAAPWFAAPKIQAARVRYWPTPSAAELGRALAAAWHRTSPAEARRPRRAPSGLFDVPELARKYAFDMSKVLDWNRAATCAAPSPGVAEAMQEGLLAADIQRGATAAANADRVSQIRHRAAEYFGFSYPDRLIFTPGATFALNQAIAGIADGSTVLCTRLEHNSALRPLHAARRKRGLKVETIPFDQQGMTDLSALQKRLQNGGVDWLICGSASNVFGTIQPLAAICQMATDHGVKVVADLSQGAGQIDFNLQELGVAYAAVPGHKGLAGPRGIGLLMVAPSENPPPLVHGGTGSQGESLDMPEAYPTRLEAGTPNFPGIYGLGAALDWRALHPVDLKPVRQGLAWLEKELRQHSAFEVYPVDPPDWQQRLGILSLNCKNLPGAMLAAYLAQSGVHVRSGMMCAALAPAAIGAYTGVVRLSPPPDCPQADFERVLQLLTEAAAALAPPSRLA